MSGIEEGGSKLFSGRFIFAKKIKKRILMDAKKITGVAIVVALIIVLGYAIVRQMSNTPSSPAEKNPLAVSQDTRQIQPGLSEEPQSAPLPDTRQPATVDAIVVDIEGESGVDQSAMAGEVSGESSIFEDEGSSLNEVSQFYDENSL